MKDFRRKKERLKRGFTLIEIMIVVAIIALLTAIVLPNVRRARINANQMAATKGLQDIHTIVTVYVFDYEVYPDSLADLAGDNPAATGLLTTSTDGGYGSTTYHGYTFDYQTSSGGYTCEAVPVSQTDHDKYRITASGLIEIYRDGSWEAL